MTINFATKLIAAYAVFTWAITLFVHELDSMGVVHWHTTDTAGLLSVAVLAALAIWLTCRSQQGSHDPR